METSISSFKNLWGATPELELLAFVIVLFAPTYITWNLN